jgi:cobalt-zinc-cadmium resistance protein CzcA
MIRGIVDFALNNRFIVLIVAVLLFTWGIISFHNLPVEAYPDVANNYVTVITQWPGRAAEEVEQQVTVPLEISMAGIPHMQALRSTSLAGLSALNMVFDDSSVDAWNRERVLERLSQVTLPAGLQPQIGSDWSPVGQIYWYTLESTNPAYDNMDLKSIEDWTLEKDFKTVPGVVDVSSFGGQTREYQVRLDPNKLIACGITLAQVEQALQNNNINAGGSFIQEGSQQINVRAVGLYTDVQDIENTLLKTVDGTPIFVRDVATVEEGAKIRLGQIGKTVHNPDRTLVDNPDTVEGVLLLQKGDDSDTTLAGIHKEVTDLNKHVLPKGVRIVPFLDRSDLLAFTTHTVLHNLTEGIVLVMVILFLFLGNVRGALIVSLTIPFALLFASICLSQLHIPANLLSLGALDFGMVVDGAVVMVENIVRRLSHDEGAETNPSQVIRRAAHEVQRPVFYPIGIIIVAYLPIFTLQSVEGRLFRPMAWTVAFALLGALIFSMFVAPVLSSFLFPRGTTEWENPLLVWLLGHYRRSLIWAIRRRGITVTVASLALATAVVLGMSGVIGSEFLPHLDEGSIWIRGTLAPSTGPDASIAVTNRARVLMARFPEVTDVVSQTGRPDDGTDTTGFFDTEYYVGLKPKDKWRPVFGQNKDALIAAMDHQLDTIPGAIWNFSQPISDNVEEAVSGVKGELAVKIYGDDLQTLENLGDRLVQVMGTVPGITDLGLFRVIGQPNLNYTVNREAAARYGINVSDVQDAIQTVVGAAPVTQVLRGEARYDLTLRYQAKYRDTPDALNDILLTAQDGERVPLAQLTTVKTEDGAEEIYRENGERYVAVKYSVRGRALGSTVEEAIDRVNKQVKLPQGYHMNWAGEYQSQKRADKRLSLVVPLALLVIFLILYLMFGSFKWALLILANVAMAPFGGMLALLINGTNFSVSSGVGFLALFGVSVQTGIIMLEYINQLRGMGLSVAEAAVEGAVQRLRPIMMTMVVATLGLLPAATSHGIGSDSQRPFAIVIVGGLIGALLLSVFLLPTLYVWIARPGDRLPSAHMEGEA